VILGRGEISVALKIRAHRVTASAKAKIEKAGGSVDLIA
jgi:large subunit ribosomal protein L15